jgi:glycosyltransferase involved in cell wall biosynthesis
MVPEKAPHVAIDAARAANVRLRLAGPIIDRAYWDEEVAPRLGTDVVYVGHLAHADLVDLFGRSRVAVQSPAWDEPFGLTAAEAAACGTPVAGFRRGGLPDAIGPASGVLTDGRDVDALADAICAAQQLDRTLVREDAELRLGIDAMGRRYEARYAELMHASPDSAPAPSLAARWPAPGIGGGRRVDRSTAA